MEEQEKYWREVHRLSLQAEEAYAALDRFFESVRAPFTEEELAAYDKLNKVAIAASLRFDDYCHQGCPSRLFPDLPFPSDSRCSVCRCKCVARDAHADPSSISEWTLVF